MGRRGGSQQGREDCVAAEGVSRKEGRFASLPGTHSVYILANDMVDRNDVKGPAGDTEQAAVLIENAG